MNYLALMTTLRKASKRMTLILLKEEMNTMTMGNMVVMEKTKKVTVMGKETTKVSTTMASMMICSTSTQTVECL